MGLFKNQLKLIVAFVAAGLLLAGCGSSATEEKGYNKEDFSKRPAPAGYGPPGGPAKTTGG
jgi:hypothetical protein